MSFDVFVQVAGAEHAQNCVERWGYTPAVVAMIDGTYYPYEDDE